MLGRRWYESVVSYLPAVTTPFVLDVWTVLVTLCALTMMQNCKCRTIPSSTKGRSYGKWIGGGGRGTEEETILLMVLHKYGNAAMRQLRDFRSKYGFRLHSDG